MLVTNFQPFPTLETARLKLRQITLDDGKEIYDIRTNEIVMKYMDREQLKSEAAAVEFIREGIKSEKENKGIVWGITLKNNPRLLGTISYWKFTKEHYRAEIGYILHPDFHRNGIMNEAIEAVINYGFDKIKLHSIEAVVNPHNEGSIRLLERNKFKREGYFRENYYFDGKFLDSGVYSLVKHWWK